MKRNKWLIGIALSLVAAVVLGAAADITSAGYKPDNGSPGSVVGVVIQLSNDGVHSIPVNTVHPLPVQIDGDVNITGGTFNNAPASASGKYSSATVGATSAQLLASSVSARVFLDIINQSATVAIACRVGASAAVVNGAGSINIPANSHHVWENSFVPQDAVQCISATGTVNVTVGAD